MTTDISLDDLDRKIINALQGGFPVTDAPFAEVAEWLDADTQDIINRIQAMLDNGILSRFGPLFNSEKLGGAVTLAAIEVPQERYEEVTELVNAHREVAHNYARSHNLNMWFVVATETPEQIASVIGEIETETGLHVYDCPKEKEFFIGLRLEA